MTEDAREAVLLTMADIVKEFPGVRALDGVDLDVRAGEVHALLGQNGAGKSTLIKVLAGAQQPDEGVITWRGEAVRLTNPQAAMRLGIATIYQELDLVDGLTVAENIYLGHEVSLAGVTKPGEANDLARKLLTRLGHREVHPNREVGRLSAAGKQIVSMARALSHDAKLIVMDEPSAVLDSGEVDNLFRVIRDLTAENVAVVYITHRLEEIREIADRVTVLKDGRTVATGQAPAADAKPVLEVEGLSRVGEFSDVSFTVRAGEIVGLAGLVGSGRSEILETVYGARRPSSGRVTVDGKNLRRGSVGHAVDAGVGLAPEERKSQGLLLEQSVARNITIASLSRFARTGFVRRDQEHAAAEKQAKSLEVRPPGVRRPVRNLSGGNQQKVVLARWLLHGCRVLLLDEPTRGVDVGARSEIYALIRRLADEGVAIVVVSSEVDEVLGLSDRVLVISEGRVVHEGPASDIDEHRVLDLVMEGSVA